MTKPNNATTAGPLAAAITAAAALKTEWRLAQCRLLDANGVANTDGAIAAAMATLWTANYRHEFGAPAAPRTIRRWRAGRDNRVGRAATQATVATTAPSHDVRHAMLERTATLLSANPLVTRRGVHLTHAFEVHLRNGRDPSAPPLRPLSYSTVRRVCDRLEDERTLHLGDRSAGVRAARA